MDVKPTYLKTDENRVFIEMTKEVNAAVAQLKPLRSKNIIIKAILFPAMYIGVYALALYFGNNHSFYYLCYFLLGILLVLNFLNLIHEAVHNTLFKNKTLNSIYVHFFDLFGANSFIWKVRHTKLHHNYPNILGWDSDFEQTELARVMPNSPYYKMNKYQHIYLPFVYTLYLLNWLLVRDFKDFFSKNKMVRKVTDIPKKEYVKLFLFKAAFIFYTIILPAVALSISWHQSIVAFLIMIFTASIVSLIVLLTPHANTESYFPVPDNDGKMETSWFMHQLKCTNDVKEDNWFTRFFMGCFNFHIAHHLYPHVNHVYYPEVTEIIKKYAQENNWPYKQFKLTTTLNNHYKLLKQNAVYENIFEETM